MKISEKKFNSFEYAHKLRFIYKICKQLEANWEGLHLESINWLQQIQAYCTSSELAGLYNRLQDFITHPDLESLTNLLVFLESSLGKDIRDNDMVILKKDGKNEAVKELPLVPVLLNLRSAFNVGSVIRTSECLGIKQLSFCGYTPLPNSAGVKKTAMGTQEFINWRQNSIKEEITNLRQNGYKIYALETVKGAELVHNADIALPCALILGNEALGVPPKILEQTDKVLRLPVFGWKNSLNVATAFAVCAYEIYNKTKGDING